MPDIAEHEAVLRANREFYEAFEARDIDRMSDVWEHSDRVICIHPGWGRLHGWGKVAASFVAIFQGPQPIQFILTDEQAQIEGPTAWVTVDENILGDATGATAAAINVFRHGPDGWKLVVHHASQVLGPG